MTLQAEFVHNSQFEDVKLGTRRKGPPAKHFSSNDCIVALSNGKIESASSTSSSLISTSTTSGFVSSGSVSSSKSTEFAFIKSGSVSTARNLYEKETARKSSYGQGGRAVKTLKSPQVRKLSDIQGSNSSLYLDPVLSSSRHASSNSTKCVNHVIMTPRNSTSTVNSRRESNTLESQDSRRSSQLNKSSRSHNKSYDDLDLDLGINDYDEDDDIFDYKENTSDNLNSKQYHNSLSTASCLENEINCLNTFNITPDTSSSSASSSSPFVLNKPLLARKVVSPDMWRSARALSNRHLKISSADAPLPPQLPTTTQSFFVQSSSEFGISASLLNFAHFDVQSVYFNFKSVKEIVSSLHMSMNIKTGASAASRQFSMDSMNRTMPPAPQVLVSKRMPEDKRTRLSASMFLCDSMLPPISPRLKDDKPVFNLSAGSELDSKPSDLVDECPCFQLELGGDSFKGLGLVQDVSQRRMMKLYSINILDRINIYYKKDIIDLIEQNNNEPFTIEYQDYGAFFYRHFFASHEHANYLGIDKNLGPVAISIRRDKIISEPNSRSNSANLNSNSNERSTDYAYRFILRTSDLNTLRGTILEEHISVKASSSKGIPHKQVIQFLIPELSLDCLRLAESKVADKLIEIDEQYLIKNHKIGILLCKSGQSTEEEMYNNRESTPAFDEFLQLLGEKVALKGFGNYRGGLDNQNDTTGTHSVYTKFRNKEIMFHVSTLLPYSNNDKQQLTRKRHIGNDLVTIVFQEPGSLPFSPKTIRSQYQHIFIIVRAMSPNSYNTQYSVAISYSKDIPSFGPALPKNPLFLKSKEFREFLLAKIVNADNVGLKCEKFTQIRMRTRNGILKDLVDSYSTKLTLQNCSNGSNTGLISQKLGLFNFGSMSKKKLRSKSCQAFNASFTSEDEANAIRLCKLNGAIFWNIDVVEDFQYLIRNCCILGISKQTIVIVDLQQKCVLFSIGCSAVIGWTINENDSTLILYFDLGECISIKLKAKSDLYTIVKRLEHLTKGCKTIELSIEKKDCGPLGFNIHHDGVVTEVEPFRLAYIRGFKQGTRIVKIGEHFVINLSHEKMIDLLRNSSFLKITFLQPFEDGSARRGQDDSFSLYAYLSTCSSINERQVDSIKTTPLLTNFQKYNRVQLPQLSGFSPQRNRRITVTENRPKFAYRLSASGSLLDENDQRKEFELTSVQSPKKLFNKNAFDWPRMVQTASRNFENAQKNSEIEIGTKSRINSSSSTYYTAKEELKRPPNLQIKECIDHNMEKTASYDELRERLLFLQLELNKEKLEKNKIEKQEARIREEYLNLQQEFLRVKEQLRVVTPSTPKSRKYSKNEFIDCASEIKSKNNTTPQVVRLNLNDTFFPNHTYAFSNDSHV